MAEPDRQPSMLERLSLRFRLGPFPVVVEPTFFLLPLVVARASWLALAWAAVTFVSVLVHELGHALAARHFGSPASIRLYALGGLTYHQRLESRKQRILVLLAGPGAGFVLGLLVLAIHLVLPPAPLARHQALSFTIDALLWVNFGWGVVNLLPVPPLDGGQVFAESVGPKNKLLAAQVGAVVGTLATLEALRSFGSIAAVMFGYLTFRSFATWSRLASERRVRRQLERAREAAWEDALASDRIGPAHRGIIREVMSALRNPPPSPPATSPATPSPSRSPSPSPSPEEERDPALLARVFEELGSPGIAADRALDAYRRDPSDAAALLALRLLLAAGRCPEAKALGAGVRWSAETARAEAAAMLEHTSPTRSRG